MESRYKHLVAFFLHLHVNIFFVKALEQVPIGAKSIIGFAHNQGKDLGRMRCRPQTTRPAKDVKEALLGGNLVSLTLLFNFMFYVFCCKLGLFIFLELSDEFA